MARAMGGGPSRKKSKDNERGARLTGGRSYAARPEGSGLQDDQRERKGKCLIGQQPSEPGGALDERGAH